MKKEMTELENKIKLLKLKIAKTEEIIHKQDLQALEQLQPSISSLASAESIVRMNVRVNCDARNVVANTTRPFLALAKTTSILSWSPLECQTHA